jgi:3-oxoacyl-[acyl-carrier-protein] synthase II
VRHRVVVTGMGSLSPLGDSSEQLWDGLMHGRSGIDQISLFDTTDYPVTIAGEVKNFEPSRWIEPKEVKKLDRFLQLSIAAAVMAVEDAGLEVNESNAQDVGVYIGSGIGGAGSLCEGSALLRERGPKRVSPFLIPRILINLASGHVSILLGAKGPNFSHVSACATGNHSIGEAMRLIQYGDAKAVVAGGGEAGIIPVSVAGFAKMRALSSRNDDPTKASRPFDRDRNGFVMSEGAGIVILEELEYAKARGARIYCEIKGYGANSDAHHMTAPTPDGSGAQNCMQRALRDAKLAPEDIQYINAHGTSTPFNDVAETNAIKRVFGDHAYKLAVSSTKSMTGHLLGAAGGLEAVICGLAIKNGVLPPTINLDNPDPECDLDYIPHQPRETKVRNILSNAFGFGGTNACLVLGELE